MTTEETVKVLSTLTTRKLVNKTIRTFTLTEQPVVANLKTDLLARGFDGTAWIGTATAEGRRKECVALFYRNINGEFDFAL